DLPLGDGKAERSLAVAERVIVGKESSGALAQLCSGQRFGPSPLSPRERRGLEKLEGAPLQHREQPDWVRSECPQWLWPRFGPDAAARLAALAEPAPLDLRVNALKATRPEAIKALVAEGLHPQPTPLSPLGLRLDDRPNVAATAAFRDGLVERQDEGSQLAALLVDARPAQRVVDFCAGAGGKTLALAAAMQNRGSLFACDVEDWRLERAGERLRRAGAHNVTRKALATHRDPWVKRHKGAFDRVLVDAPCSGTGAWRRNPDARWRTAPEDLARVVALQREILDSACRLLKPGGRLVYVTCSLLPEENDAQAEAFLAGHGDFRLLPLRQLWPQLLEAPPPAGLGDTLTLSPETDGTDGFFVAVLERSRPEAAA
ncbi:MAG TPA: RsmB/NOP family class I SAM-dependent RNA methyltransferase, partial [Kiloniellales bacterium]|nr:RsmB/NOP family class I SAM-dependent RNA methyltransferase [Kiloniellales bacterium]